MGTSTRLIFSIEPMPRRTTTTLTSIAMPWKTTGNPLLWNPSQIAVESSVLVGSGCDTAAPR
ncbi:MAG: hypothetical protein AAGA54_18425 [Myxococcota bacterium]